MRTIFIIVLMLTYSVSPTLAKPKSEIQTASTSKTFIAAWVSDVNETTAWWERNFNLRTRKAMTTPDGTIEIRILDSDLVSIELLQHKDRGLPRNVDSESRIGWTKAGFFIEDLAASMKQWRASGVQFASGVFHDETLSANTVILKDPDGNYVQVFEVTAK